MISERIGKALNSRNPRIIAENGPQARCGARTDSGAASMANVLF
jgi:hypothetical protein